MFRDILNYYYLRCTTSQMKEDGVAKEIPISSTGFLHLINKLFWNLPFTSTEQAEEVSVILEIPDRVWDAKWKPSKQDANGGVTAPGTNCDLDEKHHDGWHHMRTTTAVTHHCRPSG